MSLRPSDPKLFIHKNDSPHKHILHTCLLVLTATDGNKRGTASGREHLHCQSYFLLLSKHLERIFQSPGLGCLIFAAAELAPCPAHHEDKPALLMVILGYPSGVRPFVCSITCIAASSSFQPCCEDPVASNPSAYYG